MQERDAPIVGREREIGELARALIDARARRGRVVFVVGEWGVGTSRLVRHAAARATADGMRVLYGRASSARPAVEFRPITEALLSLLRTGGGAADVSAGPYRSALGRLVPDFADDAELAAGVSPVVLAEAVLRLTAQVGRDGGCALILDDLQHADQATLAVIEYLADNIDGQPTALLAATNTDLPDALDFAHAAAGRGSALVLPLARLGPDDVRRLAAARLEAPPDQVPDGLANLLWEDSGGLARVAHDLLRSMVSAGTLVRDDGGWRMAATVPAEVPATVVSGVVRRVERVGPHALALLSAAAVMGRRFRLSVAQSVARVDDRETVELLRAGLASGLIGRDGTRPDHYLFGHPLTAAALRCHLTPAGRATLARRAAEVIAELYPGLPGRWCQRAAALRRDGGDPAGAAALYREVAARECRSGSAAAAATLLEEARRLLTGRGDRGAHADVLGALVEALVAAGLPRRAAELAEAVDELGYEGLGEVPLAALHARLAWAELAGDRIADASARVALARALLGQGGSPERGTAVDVAEAELVARSPDSPNGGLVESERLARAALDGARAGDHPEVAFRALHLLGVLDRARGLDASTARFTELAEFAALRGVRTWGLWAARELGVNDWLARDDLTRLELVASDADRHGVGAVADAARASIAAGMVLRGESTAVAPRCCAEAVRALLAACQGRRAEMEAALAEARPGPADPLAPIRVADITALSRGLCALLEEDPTLARGELAAVGAVASGYPLAGCHGPRLLLDVLAGTAGWSRYRAVAIAVRDARWDHHFALLARAVLLGRHGHRAEAEATVARADQVGAPYPLARHLGLRLVADAASADGWGEPVRWLRRAERYFHDVAVPAVADACRALLRRVGVKAPNRRGTGDHVPPSLRRLGVTAREYEVLRLLVDRPMNRTIAERLHISPRTVEKHVAQLISKTGQPDRVALGLYGARVESERRLRTSHGNARRY